MNYSQILFSEALLDYRDFLREVLERSKKENPQHSLSFWSRRFGFKSKSFLKHLMDREKHLSIESAERVASALGIRDRDRTLFLALVRLALLEASSKDDTDAQRVKLKNRILKMRLKESRGLRTLENAPAKQTLFSGLDRVLVYAALGDPKRGSTLVEISRRSGQEEAKTEKILETFLRAGLVSQSLNESGEAVFCVNQGFVFEDSTELAVDIQSLFQSLAQESVKKSKLRFNDPQSFFGAYALSIDSRRLPEMKQRLKALISEYVMDHEVAEGDRVARLQVSLF